MRKIEGLLVLLIVLTIAAVFIVNNRNEQHKQVEGAAAGLYLYNVYARRLEQIDGPCSFLVEAVDKKKPIPRLWLYRAEKWFVVNSEQVETPKSYGYTYDGIQMVPLLPEQAEEQ